MLIVYYNRDVFNKLESDMAWQGRNVTLRIGGEIIEGVKVVNTPKAIEVDYANNICRAQIAQYDCIFRIKQLMKTKGKQPRTISVWRKL